MDIEEARGLTKRVLDAQEKIADPGLAVVPVEQLADIYRRLRKAIKLGQAHVSDWTDMPEAERKLRREIFSLADFGAVFAGQWLPKEVRDAIASEKK